MDPGAWPVRTGTTVKAWHRSSERVAGVTLSDGSREEVDLVLLWGGHRSQPRTTGRAWATQRRRSVVFDLAGIGIDLGEVGARTPCSSATSRGSRRAARGRQRPASPPPAPHDRRRTRTGDLLEADVDLATVQKMVGPALVSTTGRYGRRITRVQRKAAAQLLVPYVAPKV